MGLRLNLASLCAMGVEHVDVEDDGSVRLMRAADDVYADQRERPTIPAPSQVPTSSLAAKPWRDPHPELLAEDEAPRDTVARELHSMGARRVYDEDEEPVSLGRASGIEVLACR